MSTAALGMGVILPAERSGAGSLADSPAATGCGAMAELNLPQRPNRKKIIEKEALPLHRRPPYRCSKE